MENNLAVDYMKKNRTEGTHKKIFMVSAIIIILLLSMWASTYISSAKNYNKGEKFFNEGSYIKAVTYFDRSLQMYCPFNPYPERSSEHLWRIAVDAEKDGDLILSLIALESIKNGYFASRSFYSPGENWIKRCDEKIDTIFLEQEEKDVNESYSRARQEMQNINYNDPNIFWAVIMIIGLLMWIGAVICFIRFNLMEADSEYSHRVSKGFWPLLIILGYCLWILGMLTV